MMNKPVLRILIIFILNLIFILNAYCGIPIGYVTDRGNTKEEAIANCFRKAIGECLQGVFKIKKDSELYKHIIKQTDLKSFIDRPVSYPSATKTKKGDYLVTANIDINKGTVDAAIRKFVDQLFVNKPEIAVSFIVTSFQEGKTNTDFFKHLGAQMVDNSSTKSSFIQNMDTEYPDLNSEAKDKMLTAMIRQANKVNTVINELLNNYNIYTVNIPEIDEWLHNKMLKTYKTKMGSPIAKVKKLTNELNEYTKRLPRKIEFLIFGVVNISDSEITNNYARITAESIGAILIQVDDKEYKLEFNVDKVKRNAKGANCVGKALNDVYRFAARDIFYNKILTKLSEVHDKNEYKLIFHDIANEMQLLSQLIEMLKQIGPIKDMKDQNGNIQVVLESSISNAIELKLKLFFQMNQQLRAFYKNVNTTGENVIIFKR